MVRYLRNSDGKKQHLAAALRSIFSGRSSHLDGENPGRDDITHRCRALLSDEGEASGEDIAASILARYLKLPDCAKLHFFEELVRHFDPDPIQIAAAAERFARDQSFRSFVDVNDAVEPPRQELLRRLNTAPGGTAILVQMRADLLTHLSSAPHLQRLDYDLRRLLRSWFNPGFLVLTPITWSSPADILEKIIRYEAIYKITDWDNLRCRLQPDDRRCYALFHPALPYEPLIFLYVALTRGVPTTIGEVLDHRHENIEAADADTAVFYSISNCHAGLSGIPFGHALIKQVVSTLEREIPNIESFVTLSPSPGFGSWLRAAAGDGNADATELLDLTKGERWEQDVSLWQRYADLTIELATTYLLHAKRADGTPLDPVARFHFGNGARLDRINPGADLSHTGMDRSIGMMVNYRYHLDHIDEKSRANLTPREVRLADTAARTLTPPP
jgi:malonyl-CoA decarboxylase